MKKKKRAWVIATVLSVLCYFGLHMVAGPETACLIGEICNIPPDMFE